jgi:adenylosuccinate lyase
LKQLTRTNKTISKPELHAFIDGLSLPDKVKSELKAISPFNYTGI